MEQAYDDVEAYELAFSYRDVDREVDLLMEWFRRHHGASPTNVLELAAGPGDHALEFARRGVATTALDLSGPMCTRVRQRADTEGLTVAVVQADMMGFELDERFDLALLMLNSATYMLTLDAMVQMLTTVAGHMAQGGLLVMENSHPADFLTSHSHTGTKWSLSRDGLTVDVEWGGPDDDFDAVTQINQTRVRLTSKRRDSIARTVEQVLPERYWTATEVDAAAQLSRRWAVVGRYGSLVSADTELGSSDADRMIHVLARDDG